MNVLYICVKTIEMVGFLENLQMKATSASEVIEVVQLASRRKGKAEAGKPIMK